MNKYFSALCLAIVSCGCGNGNGIVNDDHIDENHVKKFDDQGRLLEIVDTRVPASNYEGEIGQIGQAYSAKRTTNYQLGVTTTPARMQCGRTNSSQGCTVPTNLGLSPRTVTYYIDPDSFGFSGSPDNDEIYNVIETIDDQLTGWVFNEVFTDDPWPTLFINDVGCMGSSTSNNIDAFSCVNVTASGENLTEGPGVVGTYTDHTFGIAHLDMFDINARAGSSGLPHLYLVRHAAGHAVISWMGLGSRSDSGADAFLSRRSINLGGSQFGLSAGEICRLNSFSIVGDGTFTIPGAICSGAD